MRFIQSPLNYTGGKFRLLKQILPLFPNQVNTFVDLFCGGANVGININAKHVVFNDINKSLILLLQTFNNLDKNVTFELIQEIITNYNLSESHKYGYEKYGCNSYDGLSKYNKTPFLNLRNDFNSSTSYDYKYYIMLYVLIVFAFNNQIRFNSRGDFNLPVGKRDFNIKMQSKLDIFIQRLKSMNCTFIDGSFIDFNINEFTADDFFYADPPYLITCATYNENGGWSKESEIKLYNFLNKLNENNVRFALSNVITSKNKVNNILIDWIKANNYQCHHLNYNYSNSNYHITNKTSTTDEVLITNY